MEIPVLLCASTGVGAGAGVGVGAGVGAGSGAAAETAADEAALNRARAAADAVTAAVATADKADKAEADAAAAAAVASAARAAAVLAAAQASVPTAGLGGASGGEDDPFSAPSLAALSGATLGLVVVSHDSPDSLASTIASWERHGLLALVDDKVAVLSAIARDEVELCLRHGFRVYTAWRNETRLLVQRHPATFKKFVTPACAASVCGDAVEKFPLTRPFRGDESRPATLVGPAQLMAFLEMSTDAVLFAEKDYELPDAPHTTPASLVRSLLASMALLAGNTQAVRLRRIDDANSEALPNCCAGDCGHGFNDFKGDNCTWGAHLNWLSLFCDPEGVQQRSGGRVKVCHDEGYGRFPSAPMRAEPTREGAADVEAMRVYCFTMDHSGWSNNVAMFRRAFWTGAMDHAAVLSGADNGEFEANAMLLCNFCRRHSCGSGPRSDAAPAICQLAPGVFVHAERDGWTAGR